MDICWKPFANDSSAEHEANMAPNIAFNNYEKCQVHQSNAETKATILSIAAMYHITGSMERDIDYIMSDVQ